MTTWFDAPSPFHRFTREEWAARRADTPLTLTEEDIREVRGLSDRIDLAEVEAVYLPLSRLLNLHVAAAQQLFAVRKTFLGAPPGNGRKVPFIIGMAGSVAVGKSTTARILLRLLSRWPDHPKVELVPTDGFLLPNAVLEKKGLMGRKGFPESYDRPRLLRFLADVKAGERHVSAPVYDHVAYDVVEGAAIDIDQPDILIVEGLNVLMPGRLPKDGKAIPFTSDFFDFSIFMDADEDALRRWYVARFLKLRETAFADPRSYFHRYADLDDEQAAATATHIWESINLVNLRKNILPTRARADLILRKGADHRITEVRLRKL
ncbi:MAG TPA: type I pantothenate kinase [Thermopetrobacter sp.]|nr:type I pantothenate kinase [Thermopetrobacter sp.]